MFAGSKKKRENVKVYQTRKKPQRKELKEQLFYEFYFCARTNIAIKMLLQ